MHPSGICAPNSRLAASPKSTAWCSTSASRPSSSIRRIAGFRSSADGPLDMRMSRDGPTAADLVDELARVSSRACLPTLGGEPQARSLPGRSCAHAIRAPIATTSVSPRSSDMPKAVARGPGIRRRGPFRRCGWRSMTSAASSNEDSRRRRPLLRPGGRLVVVSFHSGEDAAVKRVREPAWWPPGAAVAASATGRFAATALALGCSRHDQAVRAPRSQPIPGRSARLRVAERLPARGQPAAK